MIKFQTSEDFLDFLGVPNDHLPSTSAKKIQFSFSGFVRAANATAKSIRNDRECPLPLYLAFLAADVSPYM
jgi:hypothetical protein